jgi:hypothetical protein
MSSQVLDEFIDRTKGTRKKGSAEHLGNARSRWSRFDAMLFRHPGRVHSLRENEGPSSHVGVCVILDSAGMHDLKFRLLSTSQPRQIRPSP